MDQKEYFEMSEADRSRYVEQQKFSYGGVSSNLTNPCNWQAGYMAGRESMRQEIIPLVYGMCESDNVAARTVEAIRKIEA